MDIAGIRSKVTEGLQKYRYVILVLAVGLLLMLLPSGGSDDAEKKESVSISESKQDLAQELSSILSQIEGVGSVKVMLTISAGESTVYHHNESITNGESGSIKRDTVIITDTDRGQSALVEQTNPPVYQGAIIVCEGGDSATVRFNIIEAVARVTGLGTDRISVLKMK